MWTTPAPPSNAFVAASICAGTGEVNTSPGHAASSIPSPTKPPCSGSWPEPPPEMSATLPRLGASLRTRICSAARYRSRSGCAAARPVRDSLTTRAGSLRNFRIWLVSTAIVVSPSSISSACLGRAGGSLFVSHRFLDRLLNVAGVGEVVVSEGGEGRADQARNQVDGDVLRPVGGASRDRRDELGTERPGRVERSPGDGTEDQDDADHSATDHQD